MRCQLAELSNVKTRLHTGNMCCTANDQTISHLVDQLDTTPGLTVSEIDQEAASELRSMLQDMKHFRTSLEQMEVEFQELRERVRDQLSMKQGLMITLLYTVTGVALSLVGWWMKYRVNKFKSKSILTYGVVSTINAHWGLRCTLEWRQGHTSRIERRIAYYCYFIKRCPQQLEQQ